MTDTIKIYEPTVVNDSPFPTYGDEVVADSPSGGGSGKAFSTETITDQPMPTKRIAREILSTAFNTKSKKILQEFQFTPSGALQIGKYESGVTGDVRISPTGILARDSLGDTTFALDAETGDAIFKGTVRAGSLISDGIIEGGSININDTFIVDSAGNVTANSLILTSTATAAATGSQIFTTNSDTEVSGTNMSVTFVRNTTVLLNAFGTGYFTDGGTGSPWDGRITFKIQTWNGSSWTTRASIIHQGGHYATFDVMTSFSPIGSMSAIVKLSAGSYQFRIAGYLDSLTNTAWYFLHKGSLNYITLGSW